MRIDLADPDMRDVTWDDLAVCEPLVVASCHVEWVPDAQRVIVTITTQSGHEVTTEVVAPGNATQRNYFTDRGQSMANITIRETT